MMQVLDPEFWNDRYRTGETGWDIGYPAPALTKYADQLVDKSIHILIPGAGNAYEAEYLHDGGFTNVDVLDWSVEAVERFQERAPHFPKDRVIQTDFFDWKGHYDLILEQTFFCALDPSLRSEYAKKAHELLKLGGKIAGVLFNIPLYDDHPPFGGNADTYRPIFEPWFDIQIMETCYNSIPPRAGNELFIKLQRKSR